MALNPPGSRFDQVLRRLGTLPASRGGVALLLANSLTAVVCWFLPLVDHLGFEFAGVLTIVNAIVAPAVGSSAIYAERLKSRRERSYSAAALAACTWAILLLAVPAILMGLNGLRRPSCDPRHGLLWLLLLPMPTAVLGASLGALMRSVFRSNFGNGVRVALVLVASLAFSLLSIYRGPSFFVFDHFLGYFPGPLYDDVVPLTQALLGFRCLTLLWALALVIACAAIGAEWPSDRFNRGAAAVALTLGLVVASWVWGTKIGFRTTDRSLAAALGGERTIEGIELHYPREWPEKTVEAFAWDAVFRASQVMHELQLARAPVVRVWVYRSADEKQRLVGASTTSFTKPWRHEIHINADAFPHPVLRHELTHAYGAEITHGPFGTPGGLFPQVPLVEGFAEALDVDSDGLTLQQWAKAMRELQIAPDVTALFSSADFYATAPERAYMYAGAFLRYLDKRFGRDRLLDLYATGDLTRLGKPEDLAADFNKSLDTITLTSAERAHAERRLARPSIFRRQCAREVSALEDEGSELLAAGRQQAAVATYEHVCAMEPDDPGLLLALLRTAVSLNDHTLRDETASRILSHPRTDPVLRAETLMEVGDDLWRHGSGTEAAARYAEILTLPADAGTHRAAIIKRECVRDPALTSLLEPLLAEGDADLRELFSMNDYVQAHAGDRLVRYLLGRQFIQRNTISRGLTLLQPCAERPLLGDAELWLETYRLIVRGDAELHHCPEADAATQALAKAGAGTADLEVANDWVARCRFDAEHRRPPSPEPSL